MKHIILDLDNTIYPVSSIGDKLFEPLFRLLANPEFQLSASAIQKARQQIMRIPFQKVAREFEFPDQLTESALALLRNLTYNEKMTYFDGYPLVRELDTIKFLLTTGFQKLQESKVRSLGIGEDFTEIFIIDPDRSKMTKKDVMIRIMEKYSLKPGDLLVIGDDPESEIKAGNELDIETYLLDPEELYLDTTATYRGKTLAEVLNYIQQSGSRE